jgi:hypothetical protein
MSEVNNTPASVDDGIPEVSFTLEVSNTTQAPVDDTLSIEGMAADAKATGDAIQAAKDDLQEQIDNIETGVESVAGRLFPVGAVYISTSSTAPAFGGNTWVWQEIKMPATWGDIEDGFRSYQNVDSGDTPGTLHFWKRTA